jgi:outer membrane biosynthesis protein TonB
MTDWRRVCLDTLNLVSRNKDAWIFHNPVIESPDLSHEDKLAYVRIIPEPMDFRTIKKNIPYFSSPYEFEKDMQLVFDNCMRFNRPGQDAYEMGKDVMNYFKSKWNDTDRRVNAIALFDQDAGRNTSPRPKLPPPVYDPERRMVIQPSGGGSGKSGSPTSSVVSSFSKTSSKTKTKIQPKPEEESLVIVPCDWRAVCREIVGQLKQRPGNAWFLLPVHKYTAISVEVKKQYYSVIRFPMDFETIERNLPLYPSPSELRRDLELIVTNSVRFNPPESPVNLAARELQAEINNFFDKQFSELFSRCGKSDWGKVRKISPDLPPADLLPTESVVEKQPSAVRIKRIKTTESPPEKPTPTESPTPSSAPTPKPSTILLTNREMAPMSMMATDWRMCASHLLTELEQVKDEGSNQKLSWIFQKPIYKFDLPDQIKRLYLLSIGDELVDLQTVAVRLAHRLTGNGYSSPLEFENDMQVMFDNCLAFNDEAQYPHKVGYVLWRHYEKYWYNGGLREKAMELYQRFPGSVRPAVAQTSTDQPNWDELRNLAATEAVNKPVIDFEHSTAAATTPLNDELLYEWRVSQRYVMQKIRENIRMEKRK